MERKQLNTQSPAAGKKTGIPPRGARPLLFLVWVICLLTLAQLLAPGVLAANSIQVKVSPLRLDPTSPNRRTFGMLLFMNGFELASRDSRFGGLSGLALSDDGQTLYAVSDRGYWFSAILTKDAEGRLVGMGPWTVASLVDTDGKVIRSRERDAEALTRDRNGSFIVAFERSPRLWRYPASPAPFGRPPQSLPLPPEIFHAPNNAGLEATTVLLDGRLLLLTENFQNPDGTVKGWIFENNRYAPVSYISKDEFLPTDLATLPDGDLLLVERQYRVLRGAVVRLRRIPGPDLKAGARLRGKEILLLAPPLEVDNFEGVAVGRDTTKGTFVYLVSDDNYSPLQRTLLLQFRLIEAVP